MGSNSAGIRAQLWAFVTVLWTAATFTAKWSGLDLPEDMYVVWGAVFFGGFRLAEAAYDNWRKP